MASRSSQPPAKKQRGGMGKPTAGGGGPKGKKRQGVLTVEQLEADSVSQLAAQYWRGDNTKPFSSQVIDQIYQKELQSVRKVMMLEVSQYLELYLWKHYKPGEATLSHTMSIMIMINEKFRERVPAWEALKNNPDNFSGFFHEVMKLAVNPEKLTYKSQTVVLVFLIHIFNSLILSLLIDMLSC